MIRDLTQRSIELVFKWDMLDFLLLCSIEVEFTGCFSGTISGTEKFLNECQLTLLLYL
jgi:hypothetical protein